MDDSRRNFLRLLGGAAGAGLAPLNFLGCGVAGGARAVNSPYVPTPERPLTPNDLFYINYNFGLPDVVPAPRAWRLHVNGLVDRPAALSLDALRALGEVTREVTLECIGNRPGGGLISSAAFTGVRLRDVMRHVGLDDRARGLRFLGLDGYPAYLPADVASEEAAMLAWAMNDQPLDAVHGAPARLLLPGRYGMFSVKWLDSVTAARTYYTYGALRGVANFVEGTTRVRSRIDAPWDGRDVALGAPVDVTGLAVTPGLGVARVEVEADGAWHPAELTFNTLQDERGPLLWSLWRFRWTPRAAGPQVLRVRAFDAAGGAQREEGRFPYDGSAIHAVRVVVRG